MTISPQPTSRLPAPRHIFLATAMLVAISLPVGPAGAQSFDCRAARYPDELTICRESELARLDQQLATLYHRQIGNLAPEHRDQFQRHEIYFLNARRRCGEDSRCIELSYRNRIRELEGLVASAEREGAGGIAERRPEPSGGSEALKDQNGEPSTSTRKPRYPAKESQPTTTATAATSTDQSSIASPTVAPQTRAAASPSLVKPTIRWVDPPPAR
jgi:uncharacterized protein